MKFNFSKQCLLLCIFVLATLHLQSATFTVSNGDDSGTGSLRQVITQLNSGGSSTDMNFINIGAHQINLGSSLPDITKPVTITGSGKGSTIIDGGGLYTIFIVATTRGTAVTFIDFKLDSLTVRNGKSGSFSANLNGGALNVYTGRDITITNVSFENNNASGSNGGAIFCPSTTTSLTVTGSDFINNRSATGGGFYSAIPFSATNCTFRQNQVTSTGGGISVQQNTTGINIDQCTFTQNSADSGGGGIFFGTNTNQVTVSNSTFTGNTSPFSLGGGIAFQQTQGTILNTNFSGNTASSLGGGISMTSSSNIIITGGTFTSNTASTTAAGGSTGGGAIYTGNSVLSVTGANFNTNTAGLAGYSSEKYGGAIYAAGSIATTLTGCTFTGNEILSDLALGGAIACITSVAGSNLALADCVFNGNKAYGNYGNGGAVFVRNSLATSAFVMTVTSPTTGKAVFENNHSGLSGGALSINDTNLSVNGVRFENNNTGNTSSFGAGGAAYVSLQNLTVTQEILFDGCTFTNNTALDQCWGGALNIAKLQNSGGPMNSTVQNSIFQGNTAYFQGGAIAADGTALFLTANTFTGNNSQNGYGGAVSYNPALVPNTTPSVFSGCTYTGNTALSYGGAIYIEDTNRTRSYGITIEGTGTNPSFFTNNSGGEQGGAAYLMGVTALIKDVEFNNNGSYSGINTIDGGAIYAERQAYTNTALNDVLTINGVVSFSNNAATARGGAICTSDIPLVLDKIAFTQNRATGSTGRGGAIYTQSAVVPVTSAITNCTFSSNQATPALAAANTLYGGGAVYAQGGTVLHTLNIGGTSDANSLFEDNTATCLGGAIFTNNVVLGISYVAFDANSASIAGAVALSNSSAANKKIVTINHSLFQNNVANVSVVGNYLYGGGVIYSHYTDLRVLNSTITDNSLLNGNNIANNILSVAAGTAILSDLSDLELTYTKVQDNTGNNAAISLLNNTDVLIYNSLITGNQANYVSGISASSPVTNVSAGILVRNNSVKNGVTMSIANNTIAGNIVLGNVAAIENTSGTGFVATDVSPSFPMVSNNIIFGNAGLINNFYYDGTASNVAYNLIDGVDLATYNNYNMSADPVFVNSTNPFGTTKSNDYSLQSSSPAVETGDNSRYPGNLSADVDLNVMPRLQHIFIDRGAYESPYLQDCQPKLIWTGKANDNNWNNWGNWDLSYLPQACTDVWIPGNLNSYPYLNIIPGGYACNNIYFMMGGEVGRHDLLTYQKAHVQMNWGLGGSTQVTVGDVHTVNGEINDANGISTHLGFSAANSNVPLQRNAWHMFSAPLQRVVSGDYAFGGFPKSFIQKFNISGTVAPGDYSTGNWTGTFADQAVELRAGEGFAYWINEYRNQDMYREYGQGIIQGDAYFTDQPNREYGLKMTNGIFELPYFQSSLMLNSHRINNQQGNRSLFYYYYNRAPYEMTNTKAPDEISRDNDAFLLNEGNTTLDVTRQEGDYEILIGNPYMSTIDFQKFYEQNSSVIYPWYRLFKGTNNQYDFDIYDSEQGTSIGNIDQYIAPMQGFFVTLRGTGGVSQNDILDFDMGNLATGISVARPYDAVNTLRVVDTEQEDILRIRASNDGYASETLIAFRDDADNNYNPEEDIYKLFVNNPDAPQVYTYTDRYPLSMNFIGGGDLTIPLGIKTSFSGNVKFEITGMDKSNMQVEFLDVQLNKKQEITGNKSFEYTFKNNTTLPQTDRFFIRIQKSVSGLQTPQGASDGNSISAYFSGNDIKIVSIPDDLIRKIEVYDLQGKSLMTVDNVKAISYTATMNPEVRVAIVKIHTANYTRSFKVIAK